MEPASEETIELKISRTVGLGVHEDVDFTNFTQHPTRFIFEIELDGDFADQAETFKRKQRGKLRRRWRRLSARRAELEFDYRATHRYAHQGNRGVARIHRGLIVRIENSDSPAVHRQSKLHFEVRLKPRERWHTCIKLIPVFEGNTMQPLYGCRKLFGKRNVLDRSRLSFLNSSSHFAANSEPKMAAVVQAALLQATH